MATIGVLSYPLPTNLKLNKKFNKICQSESETIQDFVNKTIITKFEDIGMIGGQVTSDILIMRKKQKLNPLSDSAKNKSIEQSLDESKEPPAKKTKISTNNAVTSTGVTTVTTTAAKTLPVTVTKTVVVNNSLPLGNISNIIPVINSLTKHQHQPPTMIINNNNNGSFISSGKKSTPLPQAVARRNARERNRVKQVNNGFAALRQRIPEEVAEAFEAAGNGRGSVKKLSKVETLRMAVEYIRSLEKILGIEYSESDMSSLPSDDDTIIMNQNFISSTTMDTVIKTEYCSSPPTSDEQFDDTSLYDPDESSSVYFTDNLPDVTTINGQQYLRIPGTNTYQLITSEVFENEENIQPLVESAILTNSALSDDNYLIDNGISIVNQQLNYNLSNGTGLITQQQQQQQQIISPNNINNTPALISPNRFSSSNDNSNGMQSSISPVTAIDHNQHQQNLLSQLQMHHDQLNQQQQLQQDILRIKTEQQYDQLQQQQQQQHQLQPLSVQIKMNYNQLAPNSSPLSQNDDNNQVYQNDIQLYDGGILTIKPKIKIENECNSILDSATVAAAAAAGLSEESMMEAIDWWEAHTPKSEHGSVM